MKKTKSAKNYVFEGLGFPVVLIKVEVRSHGDGDHYPVINSRKLQDAVFDYLLDQPVELTGAQVAFIRKYMDLTQEQFAKALDLTSHARVSQWERAKQRAADIRPVYLATLRARMAEFRGRKNLELRFFARNVEGRLNAPSIIRLKVAA